eukprot:4401140-Amphidinium_carterae.1
MEGDQSWKTPVFFKWLSTYYVTYVHHHHDAEEGIYNPAIEAKAGKLPPKISSDHRQLLADIDKIESFEQPITAGEQAALQAFKAHMTDLMNMMEEHMNEEERIYPEYLRKSGMTEEEEAAVVEKIVQALGLGGNKTALPGI